VSRQPGRLARIDAAVVPVLSRAVRGAGAGSRRLGRATGPPGRWLAGWWRRNPTVSTAVGAVAVAVVLILTTGGDRHHATAPPPPVPSEVLPGNALGPITGEQVSAYEATVRERMSELQTSKAPRVTAVVDFTSYLTAAAAESVAAGLGQVQITQAFAQAAPPAAGPVHAIALPAGSDLGVELTKIARAAHQIVVRYRANVLIAQRHPTAKNQQTVADYADLADQDEVDSAGIGANVGCVFAITVTGSPRELQTLATRSDVRILDPAPANVATADLRVIPLQPQVIGSVPALTFPIAF
jgi:hypothetical protein